MMLQSMFMFSFKTALFCNCTINSIKQTILHTLSRKDYSSMKCVEMYGWDKLKELWTLQTISMRELHAYSECRNKYLKIIYYVH